MAFPQSPKLDVLSEIAECPLTASPLLPVRAEEISELNGRVRERTLRHADGTPVAEELGAALRTADGGLVYRVDDGIAALLPALAIAADDGGPSAEALEGDKRVVQEFYETFGWRKEGDHYLDTLTFVDLRPVSTDYLERCRLRVRRHLPAQGRFLLDAGSGPVQYEEYRRLADGFDFHVCVDFSPRALREAQRNLGEHGLYVLGDVTRLPFRAESFDAAVSLHTIYHVSAPQQQTAFEELHRVLKPGAPAVVVYEWGQRQFVRRAARKAARAIAHVAGRAGSPAQVATSGPPALYAHKHTYRWFRRQHWPFEADIRVWRSVRGTFLRRFVHDRLGGRALLGLLYRLEERAPRLAGRFGRFPMIVIQKSR